MSTYPNFPFTTSLVTLLTLPRISTWLDLQLWCQAKGFKIQLSWDLGFFENSDLFEISFFLFPQRSFWSFYQVHDPFHSASLFQTRKHISDAMCYAMYDHEWHVWVFKLVFHLNLFCSSVLGFFAFLRPCIPYGPARLVYHASILSLKSILTFDVFLSCHDFLCVRIVILRFNYKRHTRLTSIFPCWIFFWKIDFRIINRSRMSNEKFLRQSI